MMTFFSPGQYVRHTREPGWGLGQVQSAVVDRITVNFEHAGKQLIIGGLELVRVTEKEIVESRERSTKGK